jgi:integrase/recombinase XerC
MEIEAFILRLRLRGCSDETCRAYRQDIERFEAFLRSLHLRTDQVTTKTIDQFVQYLHDTCGRTVGTGLAPASVSRRLAVVSKYYRFLQLNSNGRTRNPLIGYERPKVDNRKCRAVEQGQLTKLMNDVTEKRDRALIVLFVFTGLRLSELCQLDVNTIQLHTRGPVTLGHGEVIGKGNKLRTFVVDRIAMMIVREYLATRQDRNGPLFLSSRKTRLSCRGIQQVVYRWCDRLGIPRVHPHQFRHSFAKRMVNGGMRSTDLQVLLGHESPQTTRRYYEIEPDRLAREYFSAMEFLQPEEPQ